MSWTRPLLTACLTQTGHLQVVQSLLGSWGGVGKGILLLGCLPAQWLPACNTTQLSHAEPLVELWLEMTHWSVCKGWPKDGLAHGWHLHTVLICLSLLFPPPCPPFHLCLSVCLSVQCLWAMFRQEETSVRAGSHNLPVLLQTHGRIL